MNKSSLKKFATNARLELLEKVELQARRIGITADSIKKADIESSDAVYIDGRQLSNTERNQRNKLISRIEEIGFYRVMEETSYAWFNRFVALRYMEVNDYLPTRVRVLSSETDSAEPDMMKEALSLDLELDKKKVYEYKLNNQTDELFKYLIKVHCNDLSRYMPFMFETVENYTEILFPEGLLGTDSFVRQMTDTNYIPENYWEKVEIVGWLYQYYISDENERVIRAKKRYKAEELPFATQLFTPEWIVRYMVQNALGRYWTESHPEDKDLINNWEFYLKNQQEDYDEKIKPYINKELEIEDIKCFDPAMGSGHILVYMFDVLYEIYSKNGYVERDIPRLIIEKNLYGLDIDDRAYQLASFSVVMKALQYNRRFLRSIERDGLEMNLASIQETNSLSDEEIAYLAGESLGESFDEMKNFISQFKDGKSIGSLIKIEYHNEEFLKQRLIDIEEQPDDLFELDLKDRTLVLFKNLIKQVGLMDCKYDVFITNPPYVGNKYLTTEIALYLRENYADVKSDLFSSFIDYSMETTKENGQIGFMSPFVWMFLSSYEKLREKIINETTISSLIQLEYSGFDGATVPICTFTLRNFNIDLEGEYVRLSDFTGVKNQPIKTLEAVQNPLVSYRYSFNQQNFNKIPGSPIAYWATKSIIKAFKNSIPLDRYGYSKKGLDTGNNNKYLRLWYEVSRESLNSKWFPLSKGGAFRKWYGNQDYVINWKENGKELKNTANANIRNEKFYFQKLISWSDLTSGDFGARFYQEGFIFEATGPSFISDDPLTILGFMNSNTFNYIAKFTMSTMHYTNGGVAKMPVLPFNLDTKMVEENISLSKRDWDSFETSWNFKRHPLLEYNEKSIKKSFNRWTELTNYEFYRLQENEEKINDTFIEVYGLEDELENTVKESDITVRKADLERDIKSFISYAIGCIFGRYSLDEEGLVNTGGELDSARYQIFSADEDNILPILSSSYFEDDIVEKFINFVKVTYDVDTLEENLNFIANAIGRRKNETARDTLRRYFLNEYNKSHIQMYKKRPIYWLFTSGKEKAFNCLIYMHRYDKTTLSRIRTDYLHEVQTRMDSERSDLLSVISGDYTTKEINQAKNDLKPLERKINELIKYDELLHHMADQQIEIDLDDGVKVNYDKFKGLVAKI